MKEYVLVESDELRKKRNIFKSEAKGRRSVDGASQYLYFIDKTGNTKLRGMKSATHAMMPHGRSKGKVGGSFFDFKKISSEARSKPLSGAPALSIKGKILADSTNLTPELYNITQRYSAVPAASIRAKTRHSHVLLEGTNRTLVLKGDAPIIRFRTGESLPEDRLVKISEELYKAKSQGLKKEALFLVHGWSGNARETWGKFPDLLDSLGKYDVYLYNYPTGLFPAPNRMLSWFSGAKAVPTPRDISHAMKTTINEHLSRYKRFHILAHSMGGVIARDYVVNEIKKGRQSKLKVGGMILFGSPFDGTQWDAICELLGGQLVRLSADSEYLLELQSDWSRHVSGIDWEIGRRARMQVPTYAIVGTQDDIVTEKSASLYANRVRRIMASHVDLVKPSGKSDTVFKATVSLLDKIEADNARVRY